MTTSSQTRLLSHKCIETKMPIIERNRTIRPNTRQTSSKYRVNLEKVRADDVVRINIDHESKSFQESYTITAKDLLGRKNLYFDVKENGDSISIIWIGDIMPRKL